MSACIFSLRRERTQRRGESSRGGICTRHSMRTTPASMEKPDDPRHYEIRIQGHLANRWANWFEGMTITREDNGETLLTGSVVDQAALHGLLRKVRDLGMPLVSVIHMKPEPPDVPDIKS